MSNLCGNCNIQLSENKKNNKFCSNSCSAKFNNSKRKKKKRLCVGCGNQITKRGKKYCSNKCQSKAIWEIKEQQIKDTGKVKGISQARRYLLDQSKCCKICGNDSWLGSPILLICDHINGNSSDWRIDNLRMICSNCDATTPYYKNKNKGNGRAYRRKRYKLGLSF